MKHIKPITALLLLSPITSELISGFYKITEFVDPIRLLLISSMYGIGTLLVREIKARRELCYGAVFLLGIAYAIIDEGIATKSFFDPNMVELSILSSYGRFMGVNLDWAIHIAIYHGVWSILAPIAIIEAIFRDEQDKPWLGLKGLFIVSMTFIIDVIVLNNELSPYNPGLLMYLCCLVAIVFIGLAVLMACPEVEVAIASPRNYALYWFIWGILFFMSFMAAPHYITHPLAPMIFAILLGVGAFLLTKTLDAGEPMHAYAMFAGTTLVLLELNLIHIIGKGDLESLAVSLGWIIFLILVYIKIKRST